MNLFSRLSLSFAGSLFALYCSAVFAAKEESYKVEMIIFAQNDKSVLYDELFPLDVQWQQFDENQITRPEFLSSAAFDLATTAARIQRSSAYQLISHQAWIAPAVPKRSAKWVPIDVPIPEGTEMVPWIPPILHEPVTEKTAEATKTELPNEVAPEPLTTNPDYPLVPSQSTEGYVRFYKERYHHAEIKLRMRMPVSQDYASYRVNLEKGLLNPALTAENLRAQEFVLTTNKRLKPNTLFYFDYPVFGVLLQIVPAS